MLRTMLDAREEPDPAGFRQLSEEGCKDRTREKADRPKSTEDREADGSDPTRRVSSAQYRRRVGHYRSSENDSLSLPASVKSQTHMTEKSRCRR